MFDQHTRNYLEVIAFFQRLPILELHGIGGEADGHVPQAVDDLIRDWRRVQHKDLPVAMCEGLARCDDSTLFNVIGHCLDILVRRIAPKYDLRRQRRREKKERARVRQEAADSESLTAAFGDVAKQPAAAEAPAAAGCGAASPTG